MENFTRVSMIFLKKPINRRNIAYRQSLRALQSLEEEMKKPIVKVKELLRAVRSRCPECADGRLYQNDLHVNPPWTPINIYTCDRCGKKFI